MAEVWEATDQVLTRRVAVKLLHGHLARDDSFVRRFRAEAIASARLAHPSIVSVYDTFTDAGLEAIVMELVVGTTMRSDLDQHGPMRLDAVLAIGTQVADALGAAHAAGLVHRDVKPANILLSADGRVLVADFGIAKAAQGTDSTGDGAIVGTAKYLAPEQVEGAAVDGRTDLYALGVVLYEALTGQAPFVADTDTGTALARLHRDPVPPRRLRPSIPPAVEAVVLRAMARRPADRFPDAASLRAALLAAGADPGRAPAAAVAAAAASDADHMLSPRTPAFAPSSSPTPSGPPPVMPGPVTAAPVTASPAVDSAADPAPLAGEPKARRRRWPLAAVAAAIVVVFLVSVAVYSVAHKGGAPAAANLPIAGASSFDPFGDNHTERPELVPLAVDGNTNTVWQTEHYRDPDLAKGKGGVGLILRLTGPHRLQHVTVQSPDGGWAASLYAVDGTAPTDLAGWGQPIAQVSGVAPGTTSLSASRTPTSTATTVLVWFTQLPATGVLRVAEVNIWGTG